MPTFKEIQQMIEKSGVDPAKIKINGRVASEIRDKIKDLAFVQLLNKKPATNNKT
jgi:hypothetical protein